MRVISHSIQFNSTFIFFHLSYSYIINIVQGGIVHIKHKKTVIKVQGKTVILVQGETVNIVKGKTVNIIQGKTVNIEQGIIVNTEKDKTFLRNTRTLTQFVLFGHALLHSLLKSD